MKTPKQILSEANELARMFYKMMGYEVREGYKFNEATENWIQEQLGEHW